MLEDIVLGLGMIFTPENLFWAFFGVACGIVVGAIPGLSDTMAIVLFLPFTYYLSPIAGIALLMGLSKGGNFGGSIPAVLFNIPGTPQAMVTTFDGYPLAQKGLAGKALNTALLSSVIADACSDLILIFLAAPVAALALRIGPPEYTAIIFFSVVIIAVMAGNDPCMGILSVGLGLLLSTVGTDPHSGSPRFIFGFYELADGISLMPMVIGLLAFSEALRQAYGWLKRQAEGREEPPVHIPGNQGLRWQEFKQIAPTIARSTGIGACIGIIPGIGTTVGSYLSYLAAKKCSKNPERFGQGALEGIAASEAGNNAVNGPNLIPLVTLGIPGNLAAALVLGAFMMKGLIPGPTFMQNHAQLLYALFTLLFFSNLFTFILGKFLVRYAGTLRSIPETLLISMVFVFCVIGAYAANSSLFDVFLMFAFGLLGLALTALKFNLPTMLVAFFLGALLEGKVRQSLAISNGDFMIFFTRPVALVFISLALAMMVYTFAKGFSRRRHTMSH